jgi:hypothetical protein
MKRWQHNCGCHSKGTALSFVDWWISRFSIAEHWEIEYAPLLPAQFANLLFLHNYESQKLEWPWQNMNGRS